MFQTIIDRFEYILKNQNPQEERARREQTAVNAEIKRLRRAIRDARRELEEAFYCENHSMAWLLVHDADKILRDSI